MGSYEAFKRVRNQLRKLESESLIIKLVTKLHSIEGRNVDEWQGFFPWRLLLLLKWAFEYSGENYPLKNCDDHILVKLINLIHDFEGAEKNPFLEQGDIGGLNKFLRTLSFQQFWLQKEMYYLDLARQIELFCSLPHDDFLRNEIENQLHGFNLDKFLSLFWFVWAWAGMSSTNVAFSRNQIFGITQISAEEVDKFLNLISLQYIEVKKFLQERKNRIKNPYFQLLEKSPFVRYPLLQIKENYLLYSEKLIIESISNYFYDTMKIIGGSALFERFGQVFENYITKSFDSIPIKFLSERELMGAFPGEKVTDYLVPYKEFNLLVELKAIQLNQIARVNPSNSILSTELRDSVCKGVIQGYSLANSILQNEDVLSLHTRNEFFLLIITYKNLFLGAGEDAWNEFLYESVSDYLEKNSIDQNIIPPNRIIFLSLDEFDNLISILFNQRANMPSILNKLIENNKDRATKKFTFSQHIEEWMQGELNHPFLNQTFEEFVDNLKSKYMNKTIS